jgi:hypothetical protein
MYNNKYLIISLRFRYRFNGLHNRVLGPSKREMMLIIPGYPPTATVYPGKPVI